MKTKFLTILLGLAVIVIGLLVSVTSKVEATNLPKVYVCHCESNECHTLHIAVPAAIAHLTQHEDDYPGQCTQGPSGSTGASGPTGTTGSTGETGPTGATGPQCDGECITPTPEPTATPAPPGGPGDGLSDGRSDGLSSCPECTQPPKGEPMTFAETGVNTDMFMKFLGVVGGLYTVGGLALLKKK